MGSYYIPSNKLKGEGRFLYIFTTKGLIYTALGAALGFIFYLFFNTIGLKPVGIIILVVFALIGYAIGSIKIPETSTGKLGRNYAGDYIDEIIMKYLAFKKSKKIYVYGIEREDPTYSSVQTTSFDIFNLRGKSEENNIPTNTGFNKEAK